MPNMLLISTDPMAKVKFLRDLPFSKFGETIGAQWIERVKVGEDVSLAIDEEGLYTSKHVNPLASLMYGVKRHGQPIVGPALFGIEAFVDEGGVDWTDASEILLKEKVVSLLSGVISTIDLRESLN